MLKKNCIKVKFATEKDGWHYLNKIKANSTREKVPVNVYFCLHCSSWHLTSKPDKDRFIKILQERNEELNKEVERLREELSNANTELKQQKQKAKINMNHEVNLAANVDKRVKPVANRVSDLKKKIKHLRETNRILIRENLNLKNK